MKTQLVIGPNKLLPVPKQKWQCTDMLWANCRHDRQNIMSYD